MAANAIVQAFSRTVKTRSASAIRGDSSFRPTGQAQYPICHELPELRQTEYSTSPLIAVKMIALTVPLARPRAYANASGGHACRRDASSSVRTRKFPRQRPCGRARTVGARWRSTWQTIVVWTTFTRFLTYVPTLLSIRWTMSH